METIGFFDRLIGWSNTLMPVFANLMLSSGIIGGIGLLGARILKRKGAAYQSLFLRLSLLAVLLAPGMAFLLAANGAGIIRLPMAQAGKSAVSGVETDVRAYGVIKGRDVPQNDSDRSNMVHQKRDEIPRTSESSTSNSDHISLSACHSDHGKQHVTPILPPSPSHSVQTITEKPETGRIHEFFAPALSVLYVSFSLAWLILSLFLFSRAVFHNLSIQYLLRSARKAGPAHITLCNAIAGEFGVKPPRVLQSPHVQRAFLAGLFRPAIVLPLHENEAPMSSREVFLHEFAHYIRYDHLWNLLCQMGKVILPLQPIVWLLARQIEITGEFVCDDHVVVYGKSDRGYARQLYTMAEGLRTARKTAPAGVGIFSVRSYLFSRIDRILDRSLVRALQTKLHEALSFVVLFLSSMVLTGFFSFRGEALKRRVTTGESRYPQDKTAISLKTEGAFEKEGAPENPDSRKHIDPVVDISRAGKEDRIFSAEDESPAEETTSVRERQPRPEQSSLPEILLASRQDEPAPQSPELSESVRQPPQAVDPLSDAITDPENSIPITTVTPENTVSPPKGAAESDSRNIRFTGLHELHAAATDRGEPVMVPAGPIEITVPDQISGELRNGLAQGQENPVWSPNGKLIAFTGSRGRGIWAVPARGGKPALVYDNTGELPLSGGTLPQHTPRALSFTPDGNGITCLRFIPSNSGTGAKKEAGAEGISITPVIETVSIATGERKMVAENASDGCWSPDGRYFVYVDGDYYGIGVIDTATGERKRISSSGKCPTVTPDGQSLIYVDWDINATDQLFRAPLTGGKPEQLTFEGFWWNPKCSPDGEWVISSGMDLPGFGAYSHICACNLITRRSYDVLFYKDQTAEIGAWSPNGRQFCYTLFGGVLRDGTHIRTSSIHIGDFTLPGAARQAVTETILPLEFKLIGNYPNPFNPSTTIRFSLPAAGSAELVIYNMAGQKVRELVAGRMEAGMHSVVWDGRDQSGRPASSGAYISRLKMEGKVESRRMALVK